MLQNQISSHSFQLRSLRSKFRCLLVMLMVVFCILLFTVAVWLIMNHNW